MTNMQKQYHKKADVHQSDINAVTKNIVKPLSIDFNHLRCFCMH